MEDMEDSSIDESKDKEGSKRRFLGDMLGTGEILGDNSFSNHRPG
jgi:hypothetical protein